MWWPLGWAGTAKLLVMGPSVCVTCGAEKKTDLARFWLSGHICLSAEWKQMTDLESYRSESSESKVVKIVLPEGTGPGKFLTDRWQKERVGVGSDLQLELYFCTCLTTPLRSCVSSVFIM